MTTKDPNPPKKSWLRFEEDVAKLFELFGYDEVTHDTKIDGGQCDVFAKSRKRSQANIVIECKYHENSATKVNINDVNAFIYKASNYRDSGKVDLGYLVTNTGFTSDARAALNERVKNFVFLLTYDELIQSLLDINHYLREFVTEYDQSGEGEKYVEMKLINTTAVDQTLLDCLPGDLIQDEKTKRSYLVVQRACLAGGVKAHPYLSYNDESSCPRVEPIAFLSHLKTYYVQRREATILHHRMLLDHMSSIVDVTAGLFKDTLLRSAFDSLTQNGLDRVSESPEFIVDRLLNQWAADGGELNLPVYNTANYRRSIKREILKQYRLTTSDIILTLPEMPPLLANFSSSITQALNVNVGKLETAIKRDYDWAIETELENGLQHLRNGSLQAAELRLIFEDDALPSLQHFITAESSNALVLIGDYGAGKTTILRRLMRTLAENKLARQDDPDVRTPLFISLKDYNKVPDIQSLIRLFLQNNAEVDNVSVRTFKKLNEEGRFIVLLDAFDEMLTKVTKADRRRCFKEISELVSGNSKMILTGRPAYFNDFKELRDDLGHLKKKVIKNGEALQSYYELMCLQLLDEEQVEQLIEKASPSDSERVLDILLSNPNLLDLARRPVLASMISETGKEIIKLKHKKVSSRSIYEIYTNRWVEREEDKGDFRMLIDADQKSTFVRYLAMQMHLSGSLLIHYTELDKSVTQYFHLDTLTEVDHFSNDIKTCSFLSRTDDGYYFFIHKSFMEYFVVLEFEQMEDSPYAGKFSNSLTTEMIDFLDLDKIHPLLKKLYTGRDTIEQFIDLIKIEKNKIVRSQKWEHASMLRDIEKACLEMLECCREVLTMSTSRAAEIIPKFLDQVQRAFKTRDAVVGVAEADKERIKNLINHHLTHFDIEL